MSGILEKIVYFVEWGLTIYLGSLLIGWSMPKWLGNIYVGGEGWAWKMGRFMTYATSGELKFLQAKGWRLLAGPLVIFWYDKD